MYIIMAKIYNDLMMMIMMVLIINQLLVKQKILLNIFKYKSLGFLLYSCFNLFKN